MAKKEKNAEFGLRNAESSAVVASENSAFRNPDSAFDVVDPNFIHIKGARSNNLRNVDLKIPKNRLVVVTGVSGSGKSSITMDTLFAEGQRRYVESLSSYARQFLGRLKKPDVDFIRGICPAIAIEQRVTSGNNRSTVGSMTEVSEFLRLVYARIGKTISPISGREVRRHEVSDVVDHFKSLADGQKGYILAPFSSKYAERTLAQELNLLLQKGYSRLQFGDETLRIDEIGDDARFDLTEKTSVLRARGLHILVDRFSKTADEENVKRVADSVLTAFQESEGEAILLLVNSQSVISSEATNNQSTNQPITIWNNRFELDGIVFPEPSPQLFNYNNPFGACPTCEGYGKTMGIDEDKVVPDKSKSLAEGAVACWKGESLGEWLKAFLAAAHHFDFPVHRAWKDLSREQQKLVWAGNAHFEGIDAFFKQLEAATYKIQNRVLLARYRGRRTCTVCDGTRLRKEASYVQVAGRHIGELTDLPMDELFEYFQKLSPTPTPPQRGGAFSAVENSNSEPFLESKSTKKANAQAKSEKAETQQTEKAPPLGGGVGVGLSDHERSIAKRLLLEINSRLEMLNRLGLGYLTLDRISNSLSGGETQRINLTRTLNSNLTQSMYILDEPSVGLHPRDTGRLVSVLKNLRDLGNTVIVVEHEEDVIRNADFLVDMGPEAGEHGGHVVHAGEYKDLFKQAATSLTTKYLTGEMGIALPKKRRTAKDFLTLKGCSQNNLQNIDVKIPLGVLTVVSGVSGSGKTTLVRDILYPAISAHTAEPSGRAAGIFDGLEGNFKKITRVEMINQSPIGKSSRSNPVTYVKAYDYIRDLFSNQQLSKIRGFMPKHFSFNVEGGRCEACKGEGEQVVEMQFLADVRLECEDCRGRRFRSEVLDVQFKGKNIFDVLQMPVDEALAFFAGHKDITERIRPLSEVGLGYVQLGQSSSTLSGGEAQRVKLGSFLIRENSGGHIFFIFDEPTTGLHFHDIQKLLVALQALVDKGHTVLVVEHNMEVIKSADWSIDLGPEGGKMGGDLVFEGTPEGLAGCGRSLTGGFLKGKLEGH